MSKPDKVETEADAIAVIEGAGYTNVTDVEQHGATWHAKATSSTGQQVSVHVDGAGKVHEHGENDAPQVNPL